MFIFPVAKCPFKMIALILIVLCLGVSFSYASQDLCWRPFVIPVDLNKVPGVAHQDRTLYLLSGQTQVFRMLVTGGEKLSKGTKDLIVEFDLPKDMKILNNFRIYKVSSPEIIDCKDGRVTYRYKYTLNFWKCVGNPRTEWGNQAIFLQTPPFDAMPRRSYLRIRVIDGEHVETRTYPIMMIDFKPAEKTPKEYNIGLWDYTYHLAGSYNSTPGAVQASEGIAKLFNATGINWIQKGEGVFKKILNEHGIIVGGYVHHNSFYREDCISEFADGTRPWGAYPCAHCVTNLPEGAEIPGVKALVEQAKKNGGYANYDYEPLGIFGFCPGSVALFKKQYKVSDGDFKKFRDFFAKNGRVKTNESKDKVISEVWTKWGRFLSDSSQGYARRVYEAFKKQVPDGTLVMTCSNSYNVNSAMSRSHGCDQSGLAKYVDIILPQLYKGYDAADMKLFCQWVAGWKTELKKLDSKAKLWPLLMIRFSGAWDGNTPNRVRQQMIAALAEGADSIAFYQPAMMDGRYWQVVANTTNDIARFEDFYRKGTRVESQFPLSDLPTGEVKLTAYPVYTAIVKNPSYAFYAHKYKGKILLTLLNFESTNDLIFGVDIGKNKVLKTENLEPCGDKPFLVKAQQVAFILLEDAGSDSK